MQDLIIFNNSLDFSKIGLGDLVKTGVLVEGKSEGFWVRIIEKNNGNYKGKVENTLQLTDKIKPEDILEFSKEHIFSFEKSESSFEDTAQAWMALYIKTKYPDFYYGRKNPTKEELDEIEEGFEREFNTFRQ